jgi:hypothetical protein
VRALKSLVLLLPALAACPSTGNSDAGTDALVIPDAPLACQPDAGPPFNDAGDAGIEDMAQTHPPHQNACSPSQIADYAKCQGAKQTDFCAEFKPGGTAEACGACIETPFAIDGGTAVWGVIVFNGSTAFMNVEGCVNDALGTYDCGNALHHVYQCQEIVCSACTGSDFASCELESTNPPPNSPVYCKPYADVVSDPAGPCAAINDPDAALTGDVTNCFPDTSIGDPTTQQVDWLTRIVTYMCGP